MRSLLPRLALVALALVGVSALVCAELGTAEAQAQGRKKPKAKGKKGKAAAAAAGWSARPAASARPLERTRPYASCPPEMVTIQGRFCIDRWEAGTVERASDEELSPYYPPNPRLLSWVVNTWATNLSRERAAVFGWLEAGVGEAGAVREAGAMQLVGVSYDPDAGVTIWEGGLAEGAAVSPSEVDGGPAVLPLGVVMPLPEVPACQRAGSFAPKAISRPGVIPQGSTPGFAAFEACRAAGKRLCREQEWVTACKGQRGTKFPYGEQYRHGACNVFRSDHPARILHGNASEGLSDPRLNQVVLENAMLLRETGGSPLCRSEWGQDAIYDMVGNLDEWVDEPGGMFVGGFYSRATRNGCEARITAHPTAYFDYSLGFRCCADLANGEASRP